MRRNTLRYCALRALRGLYRYVPEWDTVFVLAMRSQRELGFGNTK